SSLAAAGPAPIASPRTEDDPAAPINAYGRTKLEGERAVRGMDGLSWVILRPGTVYGPGDRAVLPLFQSAKRGVLPLVGRRDGGVVRIRRLAMTARRRWRPTRRRHVRRRRARG